MKVLIVVYLAIVSIYIFILFFYFLFRKPIEIKRISSIKEYVLQLPEITIEQIKLDRKSNDYPGVYVLYNKNIDSYYVGQGKNVLSRVYSHFSGKGNGDVFADFRNGNEFSIKVIKLEDSGYSSLDKLERYTIKAFDSFKHGYNKTRGNGIDSFGSPRYYSKPRRFNLEKTKELLDKYAKGEQEVSFKQFSQFRERIVSLNMSFPGVYLIKNNSKNLFYVGKSNHVFNAVNKHFTGQGNQKIYADWKYGDHFKIRTLSAKYIAESTLDEKVDQLKKKYSEIMTKY